MQGLPVRTHVLVVEDDRDLRDSLLEVLEEAGYSSIGAEDGLRALAVLQTDAQRPDLILLDLQMPNMDGPSFRAEQLRLPALARIPVVVVTADANAMQQARTLGARAVLRKPLKLPQLLELIPQVVANPQVAVGLGVGEGDR
jgi:CheY-like chemotaxis protein